MKLTPRRGKEEENSICKCQVFFKAKVVNVSMSLNFNISHL